MPYSPNLLDYFENPRCAGELPDANAVAEVANPVCGDEIRLQLRVEDDRVTDAKYVGQGCSISQAAVSMMTALLRGRSLSEAQRVADRFTEMMHGSPEAAKDPTMGDLRALQGVSKFPVRIKCALLGFDALQEALRRTSQKEEE